MIGGKVSRMIMGQSDKFAFEDKIFSATAFSATLVSAMITLGDAINHVGTVSSIFTFLFTIAYGTIYFASRKNGVKSTYINVLILLTIASLVYDWSFFYGLKGSSLLITLAIGVMVSLITKGITRQLSLLLLFLTITILFVLELGQFVDVGNYPNNRAHIIDLYMSTAMLFVGLALLISFVMRSYYEQKSKAELLYNQLESAHQNLHNSHETKNQFFSIISHDLRNPIGALSSLGKLLMEGEKHGDMDENDRRMILKSIYESSKHSLSLLDNLLNWARAETGQMEAKIESINLALLANSNIKLFSTNAASKGITVTFEGDADIKVKGDEKMIDLVIRNLLSNALKFTPSAGQVTLKQYNQGEYVAFEVIDTGGGISSENLEKILRLDSTINTKGTENESGTGLGLKLCQQFISKNHGTLTVKSEIGEGSVFGFKLKVA